MFDPGVTVINTMVPATLIAQYPIMQYMVCPVLLTRKLYCLSEDD